MKMSKVFSPASWVFLLRRQRAQARRGATRSAAAAVAAAEARSSGSVRLAGAAAPRYCRTLPLLRSSAAATAAAALRVAPRLARAR